MVNYCLKHQDFDKCEPAHIMMSMSDHIFTKKERIIIACGKCIKHEDRATFDSWFPVFLCGEHS